MAVRAAEISPPTGPLIAGRYSLGEPLGSGGVAVVLRGWDTRMGRAVALKSARVDDRVDDKVDKDGADGVPPGRGKGAPSRRPPGALPPAALRWRIEREGRIMAAFTHPHIARVYDYVEVDGQPWLALELLEGLDLRRGASEGRPLSPVAALEVGRQMCAALAAIHAAGIVHRDVKPQNIILSSGGHATLIDFDLAWAPAMRDDGEQDLVYGTPEYMAPEQAMGERVTAATDIYALGVTLYELLTGSASFHSGTSSSVMWRHVTETPLPLREWRHDLPAPVERAVMRALAKDPRRRYASAEAMERALAQAQDTARLAPTHHGWRIPSAPLPRAADTLAPAPVLGRSAPPVSPRQSPRAASNPARWLTLIFWALALIGLTLMLFFLLALAQALPA